MEMNLSSLPIELLDHICSYADERSLKNLRCTCHLLRELTTRKLFETIHLFPNDESRGKLKNLLDGGSVVKHVRNIYLNTFQEDWDSDSDILDEDEDSDFDPNEPPPSTIEQISSLSQFPNLNHVALCFEKHFFIGESWISRFPPQNEVFREKIAKLFFSALASLSSSARLRSLAVRSFQGDVISYEKTLEMIPKALGGLRELRLSIANVKIIGEVGYIIPMEETSVFPQLPSTWLKPTMSSLEHLTLTSDRHFGFHPILDLSTTHFPNLKSLALGYYVFCHDTQLDWIISHAPTLQYLYLQNCLILYAAILDDEDYIKKPHSALPLKIDGKIWEQIKRQSLKGIYHRYLYSRRWHEYFNTFRTELPHLRHFAFDEGDDDSLDPMFPSNGVGLLWDWYVIFEWCEGYTTPEHMEHPEEAGDIPSCDEEDINALNALLEKMGRACKWLVEGE